jgi:hypothetical protein
MKNLKMLFLATMALCFVACDKDDPDPVEIPDGAYIGTLSVDQNDGTFYTQENVVVDFEILPDNTATVVMKQVKFSSRMPIVLNMQIAGILAEKPLADISSIQSLGLSGNNIVPTSDGTPYDRYTITHLTGNVTLGSFQISMKCGDYPLTFSGLKILE